MCQSISPIWAIKYFSVYSATELIAITQIASLYNTTEESFGFALNRMTV